MAAASVKKHRSAGQDVSRQALFLSQPTTAEALKPDFIITRVPVSFLSRLAGQERLIPSTGIEQQFVDTMTALAHLPHQSKLAEQVDKLKLTNYAEMSELEKQRLRELLQEKLQRDTLRNKPRE